jgi:hypothetical protein
MQKQDFSHDEEVNKWKKILQAMRKQLVATNLRSITAPSIALQIEAIYRIYDTIINIEDISSLFKYFRSIDAFTENIDDAIIELNLALDILERGRAEQDIKNYAESRKIFYQSLYKCRRYLEEALTQFE